MKINIGRCLLILAFTSFPAYAQEVTPAKSTRILIDQIQQLVAENPVRTTDSPKVWGNDVEQFRSKSSSLNPQLAAQQWLALYDRMWFLSSENRRPNSMIDDFKYQQGKITQLVAALPGPESWPILYQEAYKKSDKTKIENLTLQWLASFLMKNDAEMATVLKNMDQAMPALAPEQQSQAKLVVKQLSYKLQLVFGSFSSEDVIKVFLAQVNDANSSGSPSNIDIPDLVTLVGPQKAAKVLKQAFEQKNALYTVSVGDKTRELAIKTALGLGDKLKTPQWLLIQFSYSNDMIALYEAMAKKFPASSDNASNDQLTQNHKPIADFSYFLALVMADRPKEAKQFVAKLQFDPNTALSVRDFVKFMNRAGRVPQLYAFFYEVLKENPQLELWEYFIPISASVGKTDETITLLQKALEQKNFSDVTIFKFKKYLFNAYLAMDQIEDAGKIIQELKFAMNPSWTEQQKASYLAVCSSFGSKAIAAGKLLDRKDWVEQGLALLRLTVAQPNNNQDYVYIPALIDLERYDEAEEFIHQRIFQTIKESKDSYLKTWSLEYLGQSLLEIYHKTNRSEDIIILVQDFPYWSGISLGDIGQDSDAEYYLANAYYRRGDLKIAAELAKNIIAKNGSNDPAYELLIKILGVEVLPWLDEVYSRDSFEERPLIWKAKVLSDHQQYDQAEELVKKAIAIDPSDGEEGLGDRMRAYAVLAEIKKVKKENDHEFFENIVQAIRLSEQADKFYHGGLLTRGLKMYEKALGIFNNAYCIQSRLAVQLEALGQTQQAKAHFIKAYELMPDSFGRRESHCFGCESVFGTKQRQKIADKVFKDLIKKSPNKPQVYYLMGYLRLEQGLAPEAFSYFKKAAELDPLYINAWKKMSEISQSIYLPSEQINTITLNLLKLDPVFHYHDSGSLLRVNDVKAMWTILTTAPRLKEMELNPRLYPLTAAVEWQAKQDDKGRYNQVGRGKEADPGDLLSRHVLVDSLDVFRVVR